MSQPLKKRKVVLNIEGANAWLRLSPFGALMCEDGVFPMPRLKGWTMLVLLGVIWIAVTALVASLFEITMPGAAIIVCTASYVYFVIGAVACILMRQGSQEIDDIVLFLIGIIFDMMLLGAGTAVNAIFVTEESFKA